MNDDDVPFWVSAMRFSHVLRWWAMIPPLLLSSNRWRMVKITAILVYPPANIFKTTERSTMLWENSSFRQGHFQSLCNSHHRRLMMVGRLDVWRIRQDVEDEARILPTIYWPGSLKKSYVWKIHLNKRVRRMRSGGLVLVPWFLEVQVGAFF